ncbi:MAG: DMT family transporter [Paramuribaculum sp.]|nr:DMT family transporter [Paramuribaculum sp.]
MNDKVKGYILGVIAAASYGTNPLFALPLYADGMNPDSVLFLRYLAAIPVVALIMAIRGRSFKVSLRQFGMLAVMGLLMAVSSLSLFMSYTYMDAGIASTLLFVYPVMVAVIMAGVYKERISKVTIACIAVVLIGISMLGRGEEGASLSLVGVMIVMVSSLSYAIYIVGINKSSLDKVPTLTVTFWVLVFGAAVFAARLMLPSVPLTMPSGDGNQWLLWGCVAGLAILPTAVSFLCTTGAVQYIGSTPTAILGALEPVTAVVIGIFVFGESLSMLDVVGIILIISAVSVIVGGSATVGRLGVQLLRIRRMFPPLRRRK